jgi:hypothetical protein
MPGMAAREATARATFSSKSLGGDGSASISTCQPVSLEVSRAFWPRLPMASDSWSGLTRTLARRSSSIWKDLILAGARALLMNVRMSRSHLMISTFSLLSSRTMFLTRCPRNPTQAPTGSTRASPDQTASLVRKPGSRAMPLISMVPSLISETSSWKSLMTKCGSARERMISGPWRVFSTALTKQRTRSPTWYSSVGHAFAVGQEGFVAAEVDDDVRAFEAADGATDDIAGAVLELGEDELLFSPAQVLHERLLGVLGGDAAEVGRGDFFLDLVAHLRLRAGCGGRRTPRSGRVWR